MTGDATFAAWQDRLHKQDWFRRLVTAWGIYSIFLFVFYVVYLSTWPRGRTEGLTALLAFLFTRVVVCSVIGWLYRKPRPYQKYGFHPYVSGWFSWANPAPDSFPSKHTASLASVSLVLVLFNPTVGIIAFLVTILTGWARVILGYHFFADIVFGLLVGVLGGLAVYAMGTVGLFT
jgi:undecaprenyl-diphosphatase